MNRSKLELKTISLIIVTAIIVLSVHIDLSLKNQINLTEEIKLHLNEGQSKCFEELRKNLENDFVYLEEINAENNILVNKYDNYKLQIPKNWKLDNTNFQYVTNLFNDSFKLSIFKEEVDPSYDSSQVYINYSNYNIRQNYGTISLLKEEKKNIGSFSAQTIAWKRDIITTIQNDLNFYYEMNIILDEITVLTFILKSNQEMIDHYIITIEKIVSQIEFINETIQFSPAEVLKEVTYIDFNGEARSVKIPEEKCVFGVYHAPHIDYWKELSGLEEGIDFKFELIMEYFSFGVPFDDVKRNIRQVYEKDRFMLVTLQPFVSDSAKDFSGSSLIPKIANGDYDELLFSWAMGLRELGEPVFLRFANEMNGDWVEWCSWFYSLDPDLYILAWNRIHTLFRKVGADNVYFVWNPHDRTYPDYNWNKEYLYYPGDSKVDCIGLTAYNNGITRPNEKWRTFEECYSKLYREYMQRYYAKPFMITEFACNEIGGSKSEWITQGLKLLEENYPNIRMAVWWNGIDDRWIYDIDSTSESKEAFKMAISNSYFQLKALNPF